MSKRGSLLLEVLIAASILSIGILSTLNIFSSAISASNKLIQNQKISEIMDGTLYEKFLNPADLDLATGTVPVDMKENKLFFARLEVESMSEEKKEEDNQDPKKKEGEKKPEEIKIKIPRLLNVEFFNAHFLAGYTHNPKPFYEAPVFLFRYGPKKQKAQIPQL